MIRVRELVVARPAGVLCRVPALDVRRGERVCIEGPNGSGKSTLLRVLAGLEQRYTGTVAVEVGIGQRTYVHQDPLLFRGTVLANVLYGLRSQGHARREALRRATPWLERSGLDALAQRRVGGLSGGERRRVALVRAFVLEPALLLLDEPLSDLDAAGARMLADALAEAAGITVLLTTPTGEAAALAERTVMLERD